MSVLVDLFSMAVTNEGFTGLQVFMDYFSFSPLASYFLFDPQRAQLKSSRVAWTVCLSVCVKKKRRSPLGWCVAGAATRHVARTHQKAVGSINK